MQRDPEMLRLRTLAAAAILFAGITVGFALGRMSVWLIASGAPGPSGAPGQGTPAREVDARGATAPLAPKATAGPAAALPAQGAPRPGPTTSPPATLQPTMPPKAAASSLPSPTSTAPAGPASAPAGDAAGARTQEPPKPVVAPNWRAAAGDPPGSVNGNDEDNGRPPNVKLINPRQADLGAAAVGPTQPDADVAEIETDRQGIAACERRYSSFRRNDGTYQPFGGGPRLRCPLLR